VCAKNPDSEFFFCKVWHFFAMLSALQLYTRKKKKKFLSAAPGGGFVSSGSEEFNVHGV
jgi:hypothetical protein